MEWNEAENMTWFKAWIKDWAAAAEQRSPYEQGYLDGLGDGVSILGGLK